MEKDEKTMLDKFLFGFFNDFVDSYEKNEETNKKNDLFLYCYVMSLLELRKFKQVVKTIFYKDLLSLYIRLYFLDNNPKFYFDELEKDDKKYDISENLGKLFDAFKEWEKEQSQDNDKERGFFTDILVLKICNDFYSLGKDFKKFNGKSVEIIEKTFTLSEEIGEKYILSKISFNNTTENDISETDKIKLSEIFHELGSFYETVQSYEKNYQNNKIIEYYKKSLKFSYNIFTTVDMAYFYNQKISSNGEDLESINIAEDYISEFEGKLNEKYPNKNDIDYLDFFNIKADNYYYIDKSNLEKENYGKAIELIDRMPCHSIHDNVTFYNLGITEQKNKEYVKSLCDFEKALEIFYSCYPELDNDKIGRYTIYKSKVHQISDLEDNLYFICETKILKCKKEIECVKNIDLDLLEKLKVDDNGIQDSIDYDIVLLRFKKNISIGNYKKAKDAIITFIENKKNDLNKENKASLFARLAHIYFIIGDFERSKEKLEKAIDYDSENEYILRFIAQRDAFKNNFFSKEHKSQLFCVGFVSFIAIAFFTVLMWYVLGRLGLARNIFSNPIVFISLLFSFVIPVFITLFYPLLKKISVGNMQLEFFDGTGKERK